MFRHAPFLFVALLSVACGKTQQLGVSAPQSVQSPIATNAPISAPVATTAPVASGTPFPTPSTLPNNQTYEVVQQPSTPNTPPLYPTAMLQGAPGVVVDQDGLPVAGSPLRPLAVQVVDPNVTTFGITLTKSIPEGVSCTGPGTALSCSFPRPGSYTLLVTTTTTSAISILTIKGINVIGVAANPLQGTYLGTCTTHYLNATPGTANVQLLVKTDGHSLLTDATGALSTSAFNGNANQNGLALQSGASAGQPGGLALNLAFVMKDGLPVGATGSGRGLSDGNYTFTCQLNHTQPVFPTR